MAQRPDPKPTRNLPPLLPVAEAQARLLAQCHQLEPQVVALGSAFGRVLAEDCRADQDQPAFDRAMMDGFAVRSVDCPEPGAELDAVGAAAAGVPLGLQIQAGQCARVMTGGVVPSGADAVIAVEDSAPLSGNASKLAGSRWRFRVAAFSGKHVARQGAEVRRGDVILSAGSRLTAARVGVLAQFGYLRVPVRRQPRVSILPTGTEVVPVEQRPAVGQVRNGNSYVLAALVEQFGGVAKQFAPVPDDRAAHIAAMRTALSEADVLITSGGVSMGDFDLVAGALREMGAETVFHRIQLKPGKPLLCVRVAGKLVLGLPGNPVSSYVCAMTFLRPALAALSGATCRHWSRVQLPLHAALAAGPSRGLIMPAQLVTTQSGVAVKPVRTAGSADLAHFARHDVLVSRPPADRARMAGERIDVLLWLDAV